MLNSSSLKDSAFEISLLLACADCNLPNTHPRRLFVRMVKKYYNSSVIIFEYSNAEKFKTNSPKTSKKKSNNILT